MNVKKEKEMFEEWYEKHHNGRQISCDYVYEDNSYSIGYANAMWISWQASANRQGYKLVPIEPTQEMLDKFPEVVYQDTYARECSLWVDNETLRFGYKAMIGACDE